MSGDRRRSNGVAKPHEEEASVGVVDMTLGDEEGGESDSRMSMTEDESGGEGDRTRRGSKRKRHADAVSDDEGEREEETDDSLATTKVKRKSSAAAKQVTRSESIGSREQSKGKSSANGRRARNTELVVNFADIQAQEHEISKLKKAQKNGASAATTAVALRKGVHSPSPRSGSASSKRSRRQARLRMSPRSPGGSDPRLGIRKGVPIMDLDEPSDAQRKRRFANNAETIRDAILHSTAWRNKKLDVAPSNILPDEPGITVPFAKQFDLPLSAFDSEQVLAEKCAVSRNFTQAKPLTLATGSPAEAVHRSALENRVEELVEEAVPLIKTVHVQRVKTIMANMRQQVRSYLSRLPQHREEVQVIGGSFRPLQISRLEKVATRTILKNLESAEDVVKSRYAVGRGETSLSEREVFPGRVIHLSKIASLSRSTTCIGMRGTIRVEDDPIIRFVPLFTDGNKSDARYEEQFEGFGGGRKGFLSVSDDETKEYLLRYVVAACDGDPAVFGVLKDQGTFTQPQSDYVDIYNRNVREKLQEKRMRELERILAIENAGYAGSEKDAISSLVEDYKLRASGVRLRDRLELPPTHFELFHLSKEGASEQCSMGLKVASKDSYNDVARRYQNFFCRRCFVYNCLHHGINQPVPSTRSDPEYPAVKASLKLRRGVEGEMGLVSLDEVDDPTQDGADQASSENSHDDVLQEEEDPLPLDGHLAESTPDENDEENGRRRSVRSLTAASTKASSSLLSQRHRERKRATYSRTKSGHGSDVSEYLGQDAVYRLVTKEKRTRLLASNQPCGLQCSKPMLVSGEGSVSPESNGTTRANWSAAEILLLHKVEKSLGCQPCIIAAILLTKSCSDVAEFLRQRRVEQESERLIGYSLGLRDHERALGAHGNNHEHLRRTRHQRMKDRGANHDYVPCTHEGVSCNTGDCSCMRRDHYCEKACGCTNDCSNRFPGCKCDPGQCRSASCPCFFAGRECDPDVCFSCGACEVPVQSKDPDCTATWRDQAKTCGNVNILRGQMRRVGVAASETHGWGAFALEDMKKGDFIYEYTGDLLSQDEAERRGNSYDKNAVSFLFDLNEDAVVDATRKGNKSKFANHTSTEPKCVARIMRVNGEHRIGIYANADIATHEELFFDYGYNGVVPDWSQSRIVTGNGKGTEVEEGDKGKENDVASVKSDPELEKASTEV